MDEKAGSSTVFPHFLPPCNWTTALTFTCIHPTATDCYCVTAAGIATDAFIDFVVGHGELWSAQPLAAALKQAGADVAFMDTRDVLVVTPPHRAPTSHPSFAHPCLKPVLSPPPPGTPPSLFLA
jgi:hypothetical protein